MRFKTSIRNVSTFTKLTSCLVSIGKIAWLRLDEDEIRFTLMPDQGVQVFVNLSIESLFDSYIITSANSNIINLEVPLSPLHRALRSCVSASDATLRLTKRSSDNAPILCLTITTTTNTLVTQEIPVRVLSAASVANIKEPTCPEPDVHIILPSLYSLRSVVERFNKLDASRIAIAANMNGEFKMRLDGNDAVKVESVWTGLMNPLLDPEQVPGGVENHPSTTREKSEFAWVRVDGKEWGRVLKVGGISRRVVACFCEDHALVLYVYLTDQEDEDSAVLTYYLSSFVT
ncbi:Hus1-like protein [Tuber magnatum]|uniref:Checkpoint protein n=1 Tax=Tuber magnatum TaxID=42249 RepID=A0A317T184_9PEZI|nr:Hus1-like protein [Tuber magnatum]